MKGWHVELPAMRLDAWLARLPEIGSLRCARRLIADGNIRVNGKPGRAGSRLGMDDLVEMNAQPVPSCVNMAQFAGKKGDYYFFHKAAGLHTAALAGRANASLEAQLPELAAANGLPSDLRLLQRLDFSTSGLVCAAAGEEAAMSYRKMERAGKCRKFYLAALCGQLERMIVVKRRLSSAGKRMKPGGEVADELEWTWFEPLWHGFLPAFEDSVTIARCQLASGKRHQIRVHAACAGFPLAGDAFYGAPARSNFQLEHYRLSFPGHEFLFHASGALLHTRLCAEYGGSWESLCT